MIPLFTQVSGEPGPAEGSFARWPLVAGGRLLETSAGGGVSEVSGRRWKSLLPGVGVFVTVCALGYVLAGATPGEAAFPGANGKITFAATRDGNCEIHVINPDGSGLTRLTTNSAADTSPAWSRDGSKIAFTSRRDGNEEIYVMNPDGSDQRNLTNNPADDFAASWSPDGRIVFTSTRDSNREIYVMNADGSAPRNLTGNPSTDSSPDWSPEGSSIAFGSDRDGNFDLYLMNPDGSDQRNLTQSSEAVYGSLDWSPDATRIAVMRSANPASAYEIFVMNADGSGLRNLSQGHGIVPVWSPDGTKIAFISWREGGLAVFVMDANGGGVTRVTDTTVCDTSIDWFKLPPIEAEPEPVEPAAEAEPVAPVSEPEPVEPAPELGRSVLVTPVSGTVLVRLPGEEEFVPLDAPRSVPLGSEVDARAGRVELTSVVDASGALQTGIFFDGLFRVLQPEEPKPVTELRLEGGDFGRCAEAAPETSIRRLWGEAEGRFRTRGRYSSTTVRGTVWLTDDRCDGTRTLVRDGSVAVTDLERGGEVTVDAGESYLAQARRGRSLAWLVPVLGGGAGGLAGLAVLVALRRRRASSRGSGSAFCTRCGAPASPASHFCGRCGALLAG